MLFGIISGPTYQGDCTCKDLEDNRGPFKTTLPPGLFAAMVGWDGYCIVKDYDMLAKEEVDKEE